MAVYNSATGARLTKDNAPRRRVQATFTRPANTTAYAAGDVVNDSTTAPTMLSIADVVDINGGSGKIVDIILETDLATITNGTFRLYVFNATLSGTLDVDNAAFIILHANGSKLQGMVDFPILAADSASAVAASVRVNEKLAGGDDGVPMSFVCASGDNDLYLLLVATAAYTPKSGGVFRISMVIEPD